MSSGRSNAKLSASLLLTPTQMADADRHAIEQGLPGIILMEHAGLALRDVVLSRHAEADKVAILAGPGNNGGDGFVLARLLKRTGRNVQVFALAPVETLAGDAMRAADAWNGSVRPLLDFDPQDFDLVVDALFGAGLSRAPEGDAAKALARLAEAPIPVLAVDLPSGIDGATGADLGGALRATTTVTFHRLKPGHLLEPGRSHCGETVCAHIGLDDEHTETLGSRVWSNSPALWRDAVGRHEEAGHKYDRGHAGIFCGGASQTGAGRLAAGAALRTGAGLVTMLAPASAMLVAAAHLTAVMLRRCENEEDLADLLEDPRFDRFVLGPGFGAGAKARAFARAVLAADRRLVLDADAITAFAETPDDLFAVIREATDKRGDVSSVLTPHAGEFKRLFPDLAEDTALSKLERARDAAGRSGAVVVLKGRDTVIAAPDGRAAINTTGTAHLATAGTGDVLAGMIAGVLGPGAQTFEAAAAAVWMHGRAAEMFGPGLTAEDLEGQIPAVLAEMPA